MSCEICGKRSLKELQEDGNIETEHPEDYKNVNFCHRHGGGTKLIAEEKKRFHDYLVTKAQYKNGQTVEQTFNRFAESNQITNLHGEIAILRHMIENIYNDCAGEPEKLMLYSGRLSDLVVKCEKLVNTCNRIELKADTFLNETLAVQFAYMIIEIVKNHVPDKESLRKISEEIPKALESVISV